MLEQNSMLRKRKKGKKEMRSGAPTAILYYTQNDKSAGRRVIDIYVVAVKAAVGIKHSNGRNNHTPHSIL